MIKERNIKKKSEDKMIVLIISCFINNNGLLIQSKTDQNNLPQTKAVF